MPQIAILARKCTGCMECVKACPFGALDINESVPSANAACRACGLCIGACPKGAIIKMQTGNKNVNKSLWKGLLVFAEQTGKRLHPVSFELTGKALELSRVTGEAVHAVCVGDGLADAEELLHFGVSKVYTYHHGAFSCFRADAYADCLEHCIKRMRPSIVLVGATTLGRSLAPRVASRFATGLTADCTRLALRENSDLIQIRPAFGGNIMAQIVTPNTRPQFATVRYKVMDAPVRSPEKRGEVVRMKPPEKALLSPVRHISTEPVPKSVNISEAEILVVAGRGVQKQEDMALIYALSNLLSGDFAVTRPLVEKGFATNLRQVGLSGRTVRPKLIITAGVSGAVQFTASMDQSERIIAINTDPDAPIFRVAHVGIVANLYEIIPKLLRLWKEESHV